MKPKLKAPGTKRLKLKYDSLLSSFATNFYWWGSVALQGGRGRTAASGWRRRYAQPLLGAGTSRCCRGRGSTAAH